MDNRNQPSQVAGLRPEAGAPCAVGSAGILPAFTKSDGGWRPRGYLLHVDRPALIQHVVFRLADSLPIEARKSLDRTRPEDRSAIVDTVLDQGHGRRDLGVPAVAELVERALLAFDDERLGLLAWCVMPNHVHVLVEGRSGQSIDRIVHSSAWGGRGVGGTGARRSACDPGEPA